MVTNKEIAISLISKFDKLFEDEFKKVDWINTTDLTIEGETFKKGSNNINQKDGYFAKGVNNAFTVIGKYEEKYFTDHTRFMTKEGHYISFGKLKQNEVKNIVTVLDNELGFYKSDLKNLYDQIILYEMGIDSVDSFLDNF